MTTRNKNITEIKECNYDATPADIIEFLSKATCNFTAVAALREMLEEAGFECLNLADEWDIRPGGKYYVVRNDTAIFPFVAGYAPSEKGGFRIIAAHSDSPCFKLKPNPEIYGDGGTVSLNVEKYGGGIMYTWFDRPLSIAARVMLRGENAFNPEKRIIDLNTPVAMIPHLAIHFNRGVNEGNPLSVQKDMKPVIGTLSKEEIDCSREKGGVVKSLIAEKLDVDTRDILSMESVLYPLEKPVMAGVNEEFLMSGRIDDLSMAYTAVRALVAAAEAAIPATRIAAIFDNEETGSGTRQGAAAPTLRNIMERISISLSYVTLPEGKITMPNQTEAFMRSLEKSFLISADNAHAWHPNYNEKYDPTNHPVIGGGPVVKINANCKYMTDAYGDALFRALCEEAGVNCQYFVNHADVAGGSTLGNILTSQLDIAGVDMGCAIWAMHSACETAGIADHLATGRVFTRFYLC